MKNYQIQIKIINLINLITKYISLVIKFKGIYTRVVSIMSSINDMSQIRDSDVVNSVMRIQQDILELRTKIEENNRLISEMNEFYSEDRLDALNEDIDKIQQIDDANNMYLYDLLERFDLIEYESEDDE